MRNGSRILVQRFCALAVGAVLAMSPLYGSGEAEAAGVKKARTTKSISHPVRAKHKQASPSHQQRKVKAKKNGVKKPLAQRARTAPPLRAAALSASETPRKAAVRVPLARVPASDVRVAETLPGASETYRVAAPVAARQACERDGKVYFLVDCAAALPERLASHAAP